MHSPSYQGSKLSRERDQRRALIKGLATSLVLHEKLETTEVKAKALRPYFERLVTYAKRGDLASYRRLRASLTTEKSAQKMVQLLAPAFKDRAGGYTRIIKTGWRRGDNAAMAIISLVLPEGATAPVAESAASKPEAPKKPTATKTAAKPSAKKAEPKTVKSKKA